jgi:hypothetical protein
MGQREGEGRGEERQEDEKEVREDRGEEGGLEIEGLQELVQDLDPLPLSLLEFIC